jgi:Peptidase U49
MTYQRRSTHPPWPSDLPRPQAEPGGDNLVFEATESFLCMGGWMLLHEIGHIELGHVQELDAARRARTSMTIAARRHREHQADAWASDLMLDRWREYDGGRDERVLTKRVLGAVMGLSIITSAEVYDRTAGWPTHPDPAIRLRRFLDKFAPESSEAARAMAEVAWVVPAIILQLHLGTAGRAPQAPAGGYAGFRQFLEATIQALDQPGPSTTT